MARTAGLWVANGPNPNLNRMIDLVKDGAYTVLHEGHGAEQARAIHARHPDAPILVRHHAYNWDTTDPIQWAKEVVTRMKDYNGITKRLVGANEQNLEPSSNFSEANYRAIGAWYGQFASEVRRLDASLIIHFPAFAAGHSEDQNDLGFIGYLLPSILAAIRSSNAVNCHTYWSPDEGPLREMGNYGGGLRYRKVARLLKENGLERPIWIDEAGPWAQPWRVEQTAAHSEAVHRDGLLACTYFLWADPTNNAGNTINQWHGKVPDDKLDWLAAEWDRIAALPVEPEKPPEVWGDANISRWRALCEEYGGAWNYGIDPRILGTIIKIESNGKPYLGGAYKPVGEVGLMQVIPGENPGFENRPKAKELLDPGVNIRTGAKILRGSLNYFKDDMRKALMGYNWGVGNVERNPHVTDTPVNYIAKFTTAWQKLWPGIPLPWAETPPEEPVDLTTVRWQSEESVRELEAIIASTRKLADSLEATRARLLEQVIMPLYKRGDV